jgi:DNA-binding IclR family transcriptional regulator
MAKESVTRSSPGVRRVAAILNFMADHPGQSFVLMDLVRALKLSRATCHALLTGLVEVGYLYRTSDKSYVLGPALAAIGRTAAAYLSPLQVAQPEMRQLADEHDLICTAYFVEGKTAVVRERAASASHVGYLGPLGARLKLRPQTAAAFYAWLPESDATAWLDSQQPPLSVDQRQEMVAGMAFAREHGFIPILRLAKGTASLTDAIFGMENTETAVAITSELHLDETYPLASLVAPVFDDHGRVAFAIGLAGFEPALEGRAIMRVAKQLTAACASPARSRASARPSSPTRLSQPDPTGPRRLSEVPTRPGRGQGGSAVLGCSVAGEL